MGAQWDATPDDAVHGVSAAATITEIRLAASAPAMSAR
jgi:hypothetical protein